MYYFFKKIIKYVYDDIVDFPSPRTVQIKRKKKEIRKTEQQNKKKLEKSKQYKNKK